MKGVWCLDFSGKTSVTTSKTCGHKRPTASFSGAKFGPSPCTRTSVPTENCGRIHSLVWPEHIFSTFMWNFVSFLEAWSDRNAKRFFLVRFHFQHRFSPFSFLLSISSSSDLELMDYSMEELRVAAYSARADPAAVQAHVRVISHQLITPAAPSISFRNWQSWICAIFLADSRCE